MTEFITKENQRLELYIKLNKLLLESSINNKILGSNEINDMKLYLLSSIYFNLLNINNLIKGVYINNSIQNYVDPNVIANNCRALLERCALYNYLFNHNNHELIIFLISIYKYESLKREEKILEEDLKTKKDKEEELQEINNMLNKLKSYKQKELEVLQKYCKHNDIHFKKGKDIIDIIDNPYFKGFIGINDQQIHTTGYAKIIENCTSNKDFKNLYHFLSNKTHPSFVSITTFKSSINKSDYLEKSYKYVFETLFYVNYIFYLFEEEFNFEKEINSYLTQDEKETIYYDLKIFLNNL